MDNNNPPSLALAVTLCIASIILAFYSHVNTTIGLSNTGILTQHPAAFRSYIAEAIGAGATVFPTLHVVIFAFFKSKRNSSSRRRIFIGWAVGISAIHIFHILLS